MSKLMKWLGGTALAALLATMVVAQTVATFNLAGTEVVLGQAGGPGGGSIFIPSYVLRSGANHTLVATASTVSTTVPASSEEVLNTGNITTWTITLPTVPYTGQKVIIACPGGTVTTLTITATSPSGVALTGFNPTSCNNTGASGIGWTYSTTQNKWFRYL